MALADCQWRIRDLIAGPGTPWTVLHPTNPFQLQVRADQHAARAWNHGSWSGAEWVDERVIPVRLHGHAPSRDWSGAVELIQQLNAAFAAVGDTAEDVELRYSLGGTEYVLRGRPRMSEPELSNAVRGHVWASCAFIALDPLIYSGAEESGSIGLPQFDGGLTVPLTVPFTVDGVMVDGRDTLTNDGTAPTPLALRIDGPAIRPRVTIQHPDGDIETLRVMFDLSAGQWLDIDTGSHAVLLNGTTNRRGQVSGEFPRLRPGGSTIRFNASAFSAAAQLSWAYRHAWW